MVLNSLILGLDVKGLGHLAQDNSLIQDENRRLEQEGHGGSLSKLVQRGPTSQILSSDLKYKVRVV